MTTTEIALHLCEGKVSVGLTARLGDLGVRLLLLSHVLVVESPVRSRGSKTVVAAAVLRLVMVISVSMAQRIPQI